VVTAADVLEARRKDDAEYNELVERVKTIELPDTLPSNWGAFFNNIRERIDELKVRARQIGGDTTKIVAVLDSTRTNMMAAWRVCLKGDAETLKVLDRADAMARAQNEMFDGDFINQMMRKDSCIPREEITPAILTEDANTVAMCWAIMDEPAKAVTKQLVAEIVSNAQKEGFDILSIKEQLCAMGWPRSTA
jgi:hypothetical protein